MSITSRVNYETEIEFKPVWPDGSGEIGISLNLKSRQCEAATKVSNKYTKETIRDQISGQVNASKKVKVDDLADRAATRIIDQSPMVDAACVSGWNLNGMALFDEDGDKATEFTPANVKKLFTDHRSRWLAEQISEAISGIEVFTKP